MAKTTKEELTTQTNTSPEPKQNRSLEAVTGSVDTKVKAATDNKDKGFIDILYDKIAGVMGGLSDNQYLCLTLPGTIINPKDYKYDGEAKPAHVKANESKLVNKLFDASFVTGADNGRTLSTQYKTALSMLTPKLNKDIFELKNQLRKVLMTTYPYDFGDGKGVVKELNVEQVFYRLYNDYVEEKSEWSKQQADKKAELERQIIDPSVRNDKYLEWYGAVAESEKVKLQEKLGRVLSVFSPEDMNIINAILNCGIGGEVESARSNMSMVEELNPDGGYIYPVNLYPSNWFELLESSFTGTDLLESPAALSQKLRTLQMQRKNVLNQIERLVSTIPSDETMKQVKEGFAKAYDSYNKEVGKCAAQNMAGSIEIANAVIDMCLIDGNNQTTLPETDSVQRAVNKEDAPEEKKITKEQAQGILNKIGSSAKTCYMAQAEDVKYDILISSSVNNQKTGNHEENNMADVMPNKSDDAFTQIIIDATMSSLMNSSAKESASSASSSAVSFFVGGYSSSESSSSSSEMDKTSLSDMSIRIGMNVAKVTIERNWFNPGVFQLTRDMYSFSEQKISPAATASYVSGDTEGIQKRFSAMNESVLPAFPVAFIIAKDVSIKFTSAKSISASFAESVEKHASKGGGFLCFSNNSASASSGSRSASVANSNSDCVTVRFTAPQILGYYMQAVAEDKSNHISSEDVKNMSIIGFISNFKLMMDELEEKEKQA